MALDDDIRILSGCSFFEDFSGDQLRLLAFGAERVTVEKDRELYREGQPADCGYVLIDGEIELFRKTEDGKRTLRTVPPGMLIGELALMTRTTRLTSALASQDSQLMRIRRGVFMRMLEEFPETAAALHGRLTDRLRVMLREIGDLAPHFEDPETQASE